MAKHNETGAYFPDDPFGLTPAPDGTLQANLSETQAEPVWEGLPLTDAAVARARTQLTPAQAQLNQTGAPFNNQTLYTPAASAQNSQELYQSYPSQTYSGQALSQRKSKRWKKVVVPLVVIGAFFFGRGSWERSYVDESHQQESVSISANHEPSDYVPQAKKVFLDAAKPVTLNVNYSDGSLTIQAAFIISPDSELPYLVTSYRALAGSYGIFIDNEISVMLAGFDIAKDIAILEIDSNNSASIEMSYPEDDIPDVSVGQTLAMGHAQPNTKITKIGPAKLDFGDYGMINLDSALSLDKEFQRGSVLQNPDGDGYPVAVVVGNTTSNIAVPLAELGETVEQISSGISSETARQNRPGTLGLDLKAKTTNTDGAEVLSAGRTAAWIGLNEGDYLVSINEVALENGQVANDVIRMLWPNTTVRLVWIDAKGTRHAETAIVEYNSVN